jgi:DNA polymerase-3 subunit gamma/tau
MREIAASEQTAIDDRALALVARAAEGSMRDALSALDQVVAFAGATVSAEDVATVLGLVRRDLLLDIVDIVAREDAAAVFDVSGRVIEAGYDLRLVCRELARLVRDMMVVAIDPSRLSDPEIASEDERDRLAELASRYSREDLLRAFDVLSRAEFEVRGSAQPRYHLEMALLRWIHLGRLVPLADLLDQLGGGAVAAGGGRPPAASARAEPALPLPPKRASAARPPSPAARAQQRSVPTQEEPDAPVVSGGGFKETFLAEIRRAKKFFYGAVVAQAQDIEMTGDTVTFTFAPTHRALRAQFEQSRQWLEQEASRIAGRPIAVVGVENDGGTEPEVKPAEDVGPVDDLKAKALEDPGVQAMLDVFAAEITKVEKI